MKKIIKVIKPKYKKCSKAEIGALKSPERLKLFFKFYQTFLFLKMPVTVRSPAIAKTGPNPGVSSESSSFCA